MMADEARRGLRFRRLADCLRRRRCFDDTAFISSGHVALCLTTASASRRLIVAGLTIRRRRQVAPGSSTWRLPRPKPKASALELPRPPTVPPCPSAREAMVAQ